MNLNGSNVSNKINSSEFSSSATVVNNIAKETIKTKVQKKQTTVTKTNNAKNINNKDNKSIDTSRNKLNKEDYEEVEKLQAEINKTLKSSNRELQYSIHDKLNQIMIKLVDTETDEIIREFPQEKNLDIIANMLEFSGLLLDEKR